MAKCSYKLPEDLLKKLSTLGPKMDEISEVVLEGPHSVVFDEAENRLHVQKAIMATLMGRG